MREKQSAASETEQHAAEAKGNDQTRPPQEVLVELRARGIKPESSLALLLLKPEEVCEYTGLTDVKVPGILIPNIDPYTRKVRGLRVKLLGHYRRPKDKKPRRYLQAVGSPNLLYFPNVAGIDWPVILKDPNARLFFTEGELKAIKLCQQGYPCVALTGVDNFVARENEDDEDSSPIADLNLMEHAGRDEYLVYDADAATNPNVQRAQRKFGRELFTRGANPYIATLPAIPGRGKTGVDDWWVGRGRRAAKEFALILNAARSPFVIKTQSATDIAATKYKEPPFVVNGLLPAGLAVLSGAPKAGKSWLALGIAHAVATSGKVLDCETRQGTVLFCALEDNARRMQSRMLTMQLDPAPELQFAFAHDVQRGSDGCEMLVRWCHHHPNARLIVIDTLQKFRGPSDGRTNAYEADYAALSAIKGVADQFNIAILVVHHLRKEKSDDVFARVSGTTGITGASDTNMVLLRDRNTDDGTLHLTGRDVIEQEWAVHFDSGKWTWVGEAAQVRVSKAQQEIIDVIRTHGKPMTPTEIAQATGRSRGGLPKTLGRMVEDRKLAWHEGGAYTVVERDDKPAKY